MNKVYTVEGWSNTNPLCYLRIFRNKEDALKHKRKIEQRRQKDSSINRYTVVEMDVD